MIELSMPIDGDSTSYKYGVTDTDSIEFEYSNERGYLYLNQEK